MKEFEKTVITNKGNGLIAEAIAGKKIEFTKLATGCGTYIESEELANITSLKNKKQEFLFTVNEKISENGILLTAVISNVGLESGYWITEVGILGKLQDSEEEVLYAINTAEEEKAYFLPPYNGLVTTEIELSCYLTIKQDNILKIAVGDLVDILLNDIEEEKKRAQKAESILLNNIENKVDKDGGKGLSQNDYTTEEKNKLRDIEEGAEVNVQPDWNIKDTNNKAYIKNKPSKLSEFENDSQYAKIKSPVFTGDPKAPTPAETDNSTRIATTEYVKAVIATGTNKITLTKSLAVTEEGVSALDGAVGKILNDKIEQIKQQNNNSSESSGSWTLDYANATSIENKRLYDADKKCRVYVEIIGGAGKTTFTYTINNKSISQQITDTDAGIKKGFFLCDLNIGDELAIAANYGSIASTKMVIIPYK